MISHNPNEVPNEGFAIASEVVKVLEIEGMLRKVAIVVGSDDNDDVNVGWKLGRRDCLTEEEGDDDGLLDSSSKRDGLDENDVLLAGLKLGGEDG